MKTLGGKTSDAITVLEKRAGTGMSEGTWHATVQIDGKKYWVGVERGKRVRIAFKPRGANTGWKWNGYVRDEHTKTLWRGNVSKSTGIRWLCEAANIVRWRPAEIRKRIRSLEFDLTRLQYRAGQGDREAQRLLPTCEADLAQWQKELSCVIEQTPSPDWDAVNDEG